MTRRRLVFFLSLQFHHHRFYHQWEWEPLVSHILCCNLDSIILINMFLHHHFCCLAQAAIRHIMLRGQSFWFAHLIFSLKTSELTSCPKHTINKLQSSEFRSIHCDPLELTYLETVQPVLKLNAHRYTIFFFQKRRQAVGFNSISKLPYPFFPVLDKKVCEVSCKLYRTSFVNAFVYASSVILLSAFVITKTITNYIMEYKVFHTYHKSLFEIVTGLDLSIEAHTQTSNY